LRPTYQQELDELDETYRATRAWNRDPLERVIERFSAGPATFIASGGMAPVSALAVVLHERSARQPAVALTPLAAISRPPLASSAAMLFTASGKHPDAVEVMRRLGRPGMQPAAVLTHRPADTLSPVPGAALISLPPLVLREGFLAVNSIMSMSVALVEAYLGSILPARLPAPTRFNSLPADLDRLIILHASDLAPVAADLEARLSETGLAAVQVADYRNFAHGRHTGLHRNLDRTTIVAISGPDSNELASATLGTLPDDMEILRWHDGRPWPQNLLGLLQVSMQASGELGDRHGVHIGRPGVPAFGRRLYRLPIRRRLPEALAGPVDRKLAAAGPSPEVRQAHGVYNTGLNAWLTDSRDQTFGAVVFDHDGTICSTEGRFQPPAPPLAAALDRLLRAGLRVGFASGRGPSLHRDLRAIIDEQLWARVEVGLYNGAVLCRLDEDLGDLRRPAPEISAAEQRLRALAIGSALVFESRCAQLSVELGQGAWMQAGQLAEIVRETLATSPALGLKVVASAHSVDIVSSRTSKVAVVDRVRHLDGPVSVLCIGDQGHFGGNDYELLAHDRWSLSVDRCSTDPTRCWYLDTGRLSGPALTLRYLDALKFTRAPGARLKARELL
jgi:hypothetical protein